MGAKDTTPPPMRIGLVFSYGMEYCRGILRGIKQYAEKKHHWIFTPVDAEAEVRETLRSVRPQGIIAHVHNQALAEALVALRKPLVNVSAQHPELRVPRVGMDNEEIGTNLDRLFSRCQARVHRRCDPPDTPVILHLQAVHGARPVGELRRFQRGVTKPNDGTERDRFHEQQSDG